MTGGTTVPADAVRLIAFYLPQFHPIPENDSWWGKGFTEWTKVVQAQPLFAGHYQPHIPADLGFYDLRVPETRDAQADLARQYGIFGFCYYYYWFNGKRVLDLPLREVLKLRSPRFPFCICWANESWTRGWDALTGEILLKQDHNFGDDAAFIRSLVPYFEDDRYIRVNGKPLLLVYRVDLFPELRRTTDIWRRAAAEAGIGDLYIVQVESFLKEEDPQSVGLDAAVEFPPHRPPREAGLNILTNTSSFRGMLFSYEAYAAGVPSLEKPAYKKFRAVMPSWDNSPRRGNLAHVYMNASPQAYETWLRGAVHHATATFSGDERLVFINAWNEWGEGCHLEPDQRYGLKYLEATQAALTA